MWLSLWLASVLLEALFFTVSYIWLYQAKLFRVLVAVFVLLVSLSAIIAPIVHDWTIWLVPGLIGIYRLINICRVMAWRVPVDRLRRQTTNTFVWLVSTQVLVMGMLYVVRRADHAAVLGAVIGLQALVAGVLLRSSVNTWRHTRMPRNVSALTDKELPSISVLIPARNESSELLESLTSIVESDYPKLEVIVLDDCSSSKKTPDIIRQFAQKGVVFVRGTELKGNWLAKNYACQTLAERATGEILVFSCADVVFQRETLRRLVELMQAKNREMIGVMPGRKADAYRAINLFQSMRYYWELVFPRRMFKRPPVLSSLWLIRAETLRQYGSFNSAMHSISPESTFAKKAVATGSYAFVRSDGENLRLASVKTTSQQFDTSVRLRYPQLHRRLELVCLATMFELGFLLGPFVGLFLAYKTPHPLWYGLAWAATCVMLVGTYYISSVATRLSEPAVGIVTSVAAYVIDIVVLHISMFRYEFGEVLWKGRNVCIPVMHLVTKNN